MDIKKADSKGRVTVGEPGRYYRVADFPVDSDRIVLTRVPDAPEDISSYDSEAVTAAKEAVWDLFDDLAQSGDIDEDQLDTIHLADRIVRTLMERGWGPKA